MKTVSLQIPYDEYEYDRKLYLVGSHVSKHDWPLKIMNDPLEDIGPQIRI